MAIEQPIIDAVTFDRRQAPGRDYQPILVSQIGPTQTGNYIDEEGNVASITRTPEYEGQCMIHWRAASDTNALPIFEMYCVVNFPDTGTLLWSKVDFGQALNSFGEPFNPMD